MTRLGGFKGMKMPSHHPSDDLLLAYAAGTASEAESLLVASHLTLCPVCRDRLSGFERLGGALLDDLAPDPMEESALEAIFARIDGLDDEGEGRAQPVIPMGTQERSKSVSPAGEDAILLPRPLLAYLDGDLDRLRWSSVKRGIDQVPLSVGGGRVRAKLMRLRAGVTVPAHTHAGTELTLVLAGGFQDERGHFLRGDVAIADEEIDHRPVADTDGDCLCLAVLDAPLRLTGTIGRLLNPFVRF